MREERLVVQRALLELECNSLILAVDGELDGALVVAQLEMNADDILDVQLAGVIGELRVVALLARRVEAEGRRMLAQLEAGSLRGPAASDLVEVSFVWIINLGVERHELDLEEVFSVVERAVVGAGPGPHQRQSRVRQRLSRAEGFAIDFQIQIGIN